MGIGKKDFAAIEYLVRKGKRQLELYSEKDVRDVVV
jgi:succinate dehydrogenase assembly factor 1